MKILWKTLLLSFLLCLAARGAAQTPIAQLQDSLWNIIYNSKDTEQIALTHSYMAYNYKSHKHLVDSALWHIDQAMRLTKGASKNQIYLQGYKDKGMIYQNRLEYDKALIEHGKALEYAQSIGDWDFSARSYSYMAIIFNRQEKFDEALKYYNLCREAAMKAKPSSTTNTLLARHNYHLGLVYGRMNDRSRSAYHYQLAYSEIERINDTVTLLSICGNLANCYMDLQDYDKSREYALRQIALAQNAKKPLEEASGWQIYGMCYGAVHDCEGVRNSWEKATAALSSTTLVVPISTQYNVMLLKVQVGLVCKDGALALAAIDEIMPITDKVGGNYVRALMEIYRSYAHLGMGDRAAARAAFERSRPLAEAVNSPGLWQEYHKARAIIGSVEGRFVDVSLAFKDRDRYLDSMSNSVLVRKTTEIEQARKNEIDSVRRAGELAFKEKTFELELLQKQQQLVRAELERQLQEEELKVLEQQSDLKDLDLLRRAEVLRTEQLRNQMQADSLGQVQSDFQIQSLVVERQRLGIGLLVALGLIAGLAGIRLYRYYRARSMLQLRTNLARDLHDDLGSEMSALALGSFAAAQSDDPNRMRQALTGMAAQTQQLVEDMRDMVWSLHPDNDTMEKMSARMQQYAADALEPQGIELHYEIQPELLSLKMEPEARRHLYLMFKEAISNLARYARCRKADILLKKEHAHLVLIVSDDGIGFDPSLTHSGNGLRNMAERAALLGGQLNVKSAHQVGTTLHFRLPLR